jgi:hypothetical protein
MTASRYDYCSLGTVCLHGKSHALVLLIQEQGVYDECNSLTHVLAVATFGLTIDTFLLPYLVKRCNGVH